MIHPGNILINSGIVTDLDFSSTVIELGENHCKYKKLPAPISAKNLSTCIFSKCCWCVIASKEISKHHIRGSVHSTAIRQAFFYAVCCTKLFKKPSALCKEITFLEGEEIKKRGVGGVVNGTVQWFWIVTCKYVFIQQKLFDNVLNVSVKNAVYKPLG